MGFSYGRLGFDFPGLISCSLKGFILGPYGHQKALDNVAQKMAA
jgi:crotonobetainyl-CoA:carnitine CoA-transferase CaiB-like acyl-CoA transferase